MFSHHHGASCEVQGYGEPWQNELLHCDSAKLKCVPRLSDMAVRLLKEPAPYGKLSSTVFCRKRWPGEWKRKGPSEPTHTESMSIIKTHRKRALQLTFRCQSRLFPRTFLFHALGVVVAADGVPKTGRHSHVHQWIRPNWTENVYLVDSSTGELKSIWNTLWVLHTHSPES